MTDIHLQVKNFRCFPDSSPLELTLGPGFTALLGPNNCGKSSLLRLFYELRPILAHLANPQYIQHLALGQPIHAQTQGTEDQVEIFTNTNNRPLTIVFSYPSATEQQLSRIELTCDRRAPNVWTGRVFGGKGRIQLTTPFALGSPSAHPGALDGDWLLELCKAIGASCYVGPFRNAITEGTGKYYDLSIGTTFIEEWDLWRTGPTKGAASTTVEVVKRLEEMFGYKRLEINAAADKRALQALVDGKPYRLRELGAGLAQFLVVLGNVAVSTPALVLIDEPELNLHPALQRRFLSTLASYAKYGVIFATHSIGLARTAERPYSFHRKANGLQITPLPGTADLGEFLGEMSFSSFREVGYNKILLVEGATDVRTVQEFLRKVHKDHEIVVLTLGGQQLIHGKSAAELGEIGRLCDSVAVLIDSEREQRGAPLSVERSAFLRNCESLNFRCHVTEYRATENYFPTRAVQAVKGAGFLGLEPFEQLSTAGRPWTKADNWRIASAMTREELEATDLGAFLASI